jgi:hypothetical protein
MPDLLDCTDDTVRLGAMPVMGLEQSITQVSITVSRALGAWCMQSAWVFSSRLECGVRGTRLFYGLRFGMC